MTAVIERAGFRFAFAEIESPFDSLPPEIRAPFGCLLWNRRAASSAEEREALTHALLAAGCATLACGGTDCEAWHDAADEELALMDAVDGAERFVMTTWHSGETPEQVASYFANQAVTDNRAVRENLVLCLGQSGVTLEELRKVIEGIVNTNLWAEFASDAV